MNAIAITPDVAAARDFTRYLATLLRKEHGAMVGFLLALSEFDGRRMWTDLGYASLYDFLHRELKLSRSAAYYRCAAVRLVLEYPQVADALADGRLCLSTVGELGKIITHENVHQTLPRFFHLSAREARELVAELVPKPVPARHEVVTPVRPEPRIAAPELDMHGAPRSEVAQTVLTSGQPREAPPPASCEPTMGGKSRREQVEPLTADLRRLHITVSKDWLRKLDAAKDALSHSHPNGSAEEILDAALDALLERAAKRKGLVSKPRSPPLIPSAAARPSTPRLRRYAQDERGEDPAPAHARRERIPGHIKRAVMLRDQGRCQYPLHDGTICGSTTRIEFDHVHPISLGGATTIENIRIACGAHNQFAARKVLGDGIVDLFGRD